MPNSDLSVASNGETNLQGGVRFETDTPILPCRQPTAPDASIERQRMLGFARWLQGQSSPRTQRVTAGGRVVPAEPNSPPPTFYKPFLDHFVTIANKDGKQEQYRGEFTRQTRFQQPNDSYVSRGNRVLGYALQVHPDLEIPPGFQVLQTQCNGTVAILSSGTTCFFARLTESGKTNLQIMKPMGEVQNVGPLNSYYREGHHEEEHRVLQQTAAVQQAVANYQNALPLEEHEAPYPSGSTKNDIFSGCSQRTPPNYSFPSNTASSHSSRCALSVQQDAESGEEHKHNLLEGQPLQIVRHQASINQQTAVVANPDFVATMYERAIQELTEIDRVIWKESQYRTASELAPLFRQHRDAMMRCYQLREQKRYLESLERIDNRPASVRRRYEVNVPWNPYHLHSKVYQQSQGLHNEHAPHRSYTLPPRVQHQPHTSMIDTGLSGCTENNESLSNTMLSATAPSFTPGGGSIDSLRGNANQNSFRSQEGSESGNVFLAPRFAEFNVEGNAPQTALTFHPRNDTKDFPMNKTAIHAHDAGMNKIQEGPSATVTTRFTKIWPNISGGKLKKDVAPGPFLAKPGRDVPLRGEPILTASEGSTTMQGEDDPLGENGGGSIVSSAPLQQNSNSARSWTWAKMPEETEDDYAQRLKLRHSQGRGSKPRPKLDDENSPFHATGAVTREPPNSAANSLAASIGQKPDHSPPGMRGGKIRSAVVNSIPYHQSVPQQSRFHRNHRAMPSYGYGSYLPHPTTPSTDRQMPRAYLPTANPYATAPRPHGRRMQSYQMLDQLP
ncbi:hypothetical protein MMC10_008456 [Thelotrema lepadinum]|nr:hypothetical protein [Thelotrema lepadinum]